MPLPPMSAFDEAPIPTPHTTAGATAWVLVFLDGLLLACGSFYWLAQGRFFDDHLYEALAGTPFSTMSATFPAVERVASVAIRLRGVTGLCASTLLMIIALTGYRARARWAWYAVWALPFYCSLEIATLAGYDALTATALLWNLMLLSVAMFALVAPVRWFFASAPSSATPPRLASSSS